MGKNWIKLSDLHKYRLAQDMSAANTDGRSEVDLSTGHFFRFRFFTSWHETKLGMLYFLHVIGKSWVHHRHQLVRIQRKRSLSLLIKRKASFPVKHLFLQTNDDKELVLRSKQSERLCPTACRSWALYLHSLTIWVLHFYISSFRFLWGTLHGLGQSGGSNPFQTLCHTILPSWNSKNDKKKHRIIDSYNKIADNLRTI